MTKVQIRFQLERPLEDAMLARLSNAYTQYGILKITLAPGLDSLVVEYDATRLRPAEVEAAIANAGIAVKPTAA